MVYSAAPPAWMVGPSRLGETADSASQGREDRILAGVGLSALSEQVQEQAAVGGISESLGAEEVMPWMRAPQWMPAWLVQESEGGATGEIHGAEGGGGGGWVRSVGQARRAIRRSPRDHVLVVRGAIAYCARCAQFAMARLGRGLKGTCAAPLNRKANAVHARLVRLRQGRHPVTGKALEVIEE